MSYFPMFIELKDQDCLVVGGGRTALRKVKVLCDFGARVRVVALSVMPEIQSLDGVRWEERGFEPDDVEGYRLVVAASGDQALNHEISSICRKRGIPVNAVDQIRDCSFLFPAYLREGEVVSAFSSGGQSPVVAQYLKEQMRPVMTGHLGRLTACLGSIRDEVKCCVKTESARKQVYLELLASGLESGMLPSEEQILAVIEKYREKKE